MLSRLIAIPNPQITQTRLPYEMPFILYFIGAICGLVGIFIGIPPKKGEPENLQIKPKTPVFQIKNIMFHTLWNRRVPAPSVDLGSSV
jgi:hypothetical protein